MSLRDKKGVSIMIGYVLLVVIAISLSVLVYGYLKLYLPSERLECPADVSLVISGANCSQGLLKINVENRGLFSVDRAFIRAGEPGRLFKTNLGGNPFNFEAVPGGSRLDPGEDVELNFPYAFQGSTEVEIQPVVIIDKNLVLCDSISKRNVVC